MVLIYSCIDKIELNLAEETDYLVVDGGVFYGDSVSWIRLSKSGGLNKRVFQPESSAIITLTDQFGFNSFYQEKLPGYYILNNDIEKITPGSTYKIKIILTNGDVYESTPETLNSVIPLDSVTFSIDIKETLINNSIREQRTLSINAYCTIPSEQETSYFKFNYERIFILSEFMCHPLKPAKVCYIYDSSEIKQPQLLNTKDYAPGSSVSIPVAKLKIDYRLAEKNSFKVTIESMEAKAYNYFVNIERILKSGTSIYDIPPAALTGNVRNVANQQVALGYFRASSKSEKVIFTTRGNFAITNFPNPFCGLPGLPYTTSYETCCNCLNHPFSTYTRPNYWD